MLRPKMSLSLLKPEEAAIVFTLDQERQVKGYNFYASDDNKWELWTGDWIDSYDTMVILSSETISDVPKLLELSIDTSS